jgi:hypothetical protein
MESSAIARTVDEVLAAMPVVDMHTHLFAPRFGKLGLSGIDHVLTYHYLEAEFFRQSPTRPDQYWGLSVPERADRVWQTLFVENPPISDPTRGVIAILKAFGLDTNARDLKQAREFFATQDLQRHIERVFQLAGVRQVVMTNDPLDPNEVPYWQDNSADPLFAPALRIDRILNDWDAHRNAVGPDVRKFLDTWCKRMRPAYMAVSLPDTFRFPDDDIRTRLLKEAVLPACRDHNIPMALMIGVRRQVNPALRLAGDALGRADLHCVENLARDHPENRFLITLLSRENQHELCVLARKFSNIMLFGTWWFLNNPSIVEEITRERLEMLGTSFIAQNSDARVLEQLIYKWRNTRRTIGSALARQFELADDDGRCISRADIEHAAQRLFNTNFENWIHPEKQ